MQQCPAISLWSNGVKCLNYLGLTEQVEKLGGKMDNLAYIDGLTGDVMTQFSLYPLIEEVGQRPYPVSRAELQNMLMDEFGREDIHLAKKMISLRDKSLLTKRAAKYTLLASAVSLPTRRAISLIEIGF